MSRIIDTRVDLNGLVLDNPVTVASGTFGYGREFEDFIDINEIGAIMVKGLTIKKKEGNPSPRMAETPMGMINSVGLQNPGVDYFIENELPYLLERKTKIIANINGNTIDEYLMVVDKLNRTEIESLELNISCPNVKAGGMAFGTKPDIVHRVTDKVKSNTDKHLIVKLSPNVTDIKEIAKAAESAGADCLSLINTMLGMSIDIDTETTNIARGVGGLSGPAIKPIALRMVHEVYNAVDIPIIGMGGISNYKDAIEIILAGASCISIGTANLYNPMVSIEVLNGIREHMSNRNYKKISDMVGKVKIPCK